MHLWAQRLSLKAPAGIRTDDLQEERTDPLSPSVLLSRLSFIGLTGRRDQGPEEWDVRPVHSDPDREKEGAEPEAWTEMATRVARACVYKCVSMRTCVGDCH